MEETPSRSPGALEAAGDERTMIVLHRKFNNCIYCGTRTHDYLNCTKRPCYTCGAEGHLVKDCPHRRRPISRAMLDGNIERSGGTSALMRYMKFRELGLRPYTDLPKVPSAQYRARVRAKCDRLHERRITALAWHPRGRRVVSGDKLGNIALTDTGTYSGSGYGEFELRTSTTNVHRCNILSLEFESDDILWSASMDGTIKRSHIECVLPGYVRGGMLAEPAPLAVSDTALDLNPGIWPPTKDWVSASAMAVSRTSSCTVYGATSHGSIHIIDARSAREVDVHHKMHKKKISSIDVNPVNPNLLMTTSNDYYLCLWDARMLAPGNMVARYLHTRCPFGASFSPNTGLKIVETCHDNRVRIWNDVNTMVGDLNDREVGSPAEIVHSNNFNRYLSPFLPDWDPKDYSDDLFMVGRFLGDAYKMDEEEHILSPIDLFSASRAEIVAELVDMNVTTKCTLNRFSPVEDMIVSGVSFNLAFWAPANRNKKITNKVPDDNKPRRFGHNNGNEDKDDDDDDDENRGPQQKKKITVRKTSKTKRRTNTRSRGAASTSGAECV